MIHFKLSNDLNLSRAYFKSSELVTDFRVH